MARETHERACEWAAGRLDAVDVGRGATYHLRGRDGRRVHVAGRHIEGRQPNYLHLGKTLAGDPFDDVVVVLFNSDWSISYAYRVDLTRFRGHLIAGAVGLSERRPSATDTTPLSARVPS